MDMPPSRYKVVERGRRLIVVDTKNHGVPVTGLDEGQRARIARLEQRLRAPEPSRGTPAPMSRPQSAPIADSEQNVLTTRSWFDDKAPRRVRIRQDNQGTMTALLLGLVFVPIVAFVFFDWFGLLVATFLLFNARKTLRSVVTRWLDRMDQLSG